MMKSRNWFVIIRLTDDGDDGFGVTNFMSEEQIVKMVNDSPELNAGIKIKVIGIAEAVD